MFNPLNHPALFAPPLRLTDSTWIAHVPFARYLVDILRPRVIVELGTYAGVSYCAFCQAAQELQTETRCFAIDTWAGDPQSGHYGSEVLADLRSYHDPLYGSFSTLIQSSFDNALSSFQPDTIDILHIDGYHTYEAVTHDFESWLPKMSDQGVVLFHDTNVHTPTYGVWRFWEEQKRKFPSFEMLHGCGLGLLAVGSSTSGLLDRLLDAPPEDQTQIRSFFAAIGTRWELEYRNQVQQRTLVQQNEAIEWLQKEMAEYLELQKMPPVRLLRAWSRYGVRGTVKRIMVRTAPTGS